MKTYFVIYNGFWNAAPPDPVRRLEAALLRAGVNVRVLKNTDCTITLAPAVSVEPVRAGDVVLFWDKDTRLARALESAGVSVYNSAAAVALCDDKSETHRVLAEHAIPMPKTLLAPMTYVEVAEPIEPFLNAAERELGFPLVVKECFGSLGEQVYLAKTREQLHAFAYGMRHRPFLLQEFIRETTGEDKRLYVVGERVVAAMKRVNSSDFRANIAHGGQAFAYAPTSEEETLAVRCCRLLGLHFGGVDLLQGGLVCEVNSNAQMAGIVSCTGVDVAGAIVEEVLRLQERRS